MTTVYVNQVAAVERQSKYGLHQWLQKSLSFVFTVDVHRMPTIPAFEKVLLLVSSQSYKRGMLHFWEPYINNACQSSISMFPHNTP